MHIIYVHLHTTYTSTCILYIHTVIIHLYCPSDFYGICPHLGDRCEVAMMCSCLSPPGVPLFAAFASSYVSGLKTGDTYGLGAMGQN